MLDAVRDAFWRHGYEATSMSTLSRATGLEKGSLYHAFGDKKQLFLTVLERYLEQGFAEVRPFLRSQENVPQAIGDWLGMAATAFSMDAERPGCLAMNTLVEMGPRGGEVVERLARHWGQIGSLVNETLQRGQANGSVRTDRSAAELAQLVTVVMDGMSAGSRGGPADTSAAIALVVEALSPRS